MNTYNFVIVQEEYKKAIKSVYNYLSSGAQNLKPNRIAKKAKPFFTKHNNNTSKALFDIGIDGSLDKYTGKQIKHAVALDRVKSRKFADAKNTVKKALSDDWNETKQHLSSFKKKSKIGLKKTGSGLGKTTKAITYPIAGVVGLGALGTASALSD